MLTEAIRLVVTIIFAISGVYLARNYPPGYVSSNIALILLIIIFTGLGYVMGGVIGRAATRSVRWIDDKTRKISSHELLNGVAGLVIGLVIAALVAKPVESALKPIKFAPAYGVILVYLILGYLGLTLFINRRFNFGKLVYEEDPEKAKGNVLDTSVIIDGRINDLAKTGFIQGSILIPRFVLGELQMIADSADDLRRAKGRRGLDILQDLQKQKSIDVQIISDDYPTLHEIDDKLVKLCKDTKANLVTNDYNLSKVATLEGIKTLNLNDLTVALKPVVIPGESFTIAIIKAGKEKEQGVGYLDDGTMIVVQGGKKLIGKTVDVEVNSVLQTSAGKLIFTKPKK